MSLMGDKVYDTNFRLRFFLIFFCGLIAGTSILFWRSQLIFSQEYVAFPQDDPKVVRKHLPAKPKLKINTYEQDQTSN